MARKLVDKLSENKDNFSIWNRIKRKGLLLGAATVFSLGALTGCPNPYINYAPEITSIPNTQVNEDESYSYQVNATDKNNDSLEYNISGFPAGFTISQTGLITGTAPGVDSDTTYNPKVTVSNI